MGAGVLEEDVRDETGEQLGVQWDKGAAGLQHSACKGLEMGPTKTSEGDNEQHMSLKDGAPPGASPTFPSNGSAGDYVSGLLKYFDEKVKQTLQAYLCTEIYEQVVF